MRRDGRLRRRKCLLLHLALTRMSVKPIEDKAVIRLYADCRLISIVIVIVVVAVIVVRVA